MASYGFPRNKIIVLYRNKRGQPACLLTYPTKCFCVGERYFSYYLIAKKMQVKNVFFTVFMHFLSSIKSPSKFDKNPFCGYNQCGDLSCFSIMVRETLGNTIQKSNTHIAIRHHIVRHFHKHAHKIISTYNHLSHNFLHS